jgi:hypothetical protein
VNTGFGRKRWIIYAYHRGNRGVCRRRVDGSKNGSNDRDGGEQLPVEVSGETGISKSLLLFEEAIQPPERV